MSFAQRIVAITCVILGTGAWAGIPAPSSPPWGYVRDHASGRALPGVLVTVLDADGKECQSVTTDSTGAYRLDSIARSTIIYSLPGYETLQLTFPDDLRRPGECGCRVKDVSLRLLI